MNVSGVSPSAGIYTYNSIRLSELRNRQIQAAREGRSVQEAQSAKESILVHEDDIRAQQTYTSYNYAQEYRAGEEYELKGIDADLAKLDVERAISDMEKDTILHQYQYFVGDMPKATLRSGENFVL